MRPRNVIGISGEFVLLRSARRDAGVVDRDGLENRCTGNCTEGSNPSLSARTLLKFLNACNLPGLNVLLCIGYVLNQTFLSTFKTYCFWGSLQHPDACPGIKGSIHFHLKENNN